MLQKRKGNLIFLRKRGKQMKKKSLYDIAMEKKNNQTTQNENIIIVRKKPIFQTIFEIIGKILKVIIYMILIILLTVGATVLINSQTREFLVEILKNVF